MIASASPRAQWWRTSRPTARCVSAEVNDRGTQLTQFQQQLERLSRPSHATGCEGGPQVASPLRRYVNRAGLNAGCVADEGVGMQRSAADGG